MVGSLAHDVEDAWSNLLSDALRTTPDRMLAWLAEPTGADGSQSSALQRALAASLLCPEELRNEGDASDNATMQLLRRIRLMRFDFEATPSRDHDDALRDCQTILRSGDPEEASSLWARLVAVADANRAGGSIDLASLLVELRDEFDLHEHPDYRHDWEVLNRSSREFMADVRSQISGLPPLPRDEARAKVLGCLNRDRACYLVGESGTGKSALAKQIGETDYGRCIWFDDTGRLGKEDVALFPGPISEIGEVDSEHGGRHFRAAVEHPTGKLWWESLDVHHSPFQQDALVLPIFGVIGEYRAISVVLLYALSIIVRYRPSVWRRVQEGELDHMRVIIEAFLAVVERILPEQFLAKVTGQRIVAKHAGSFF